MTRTLRYLLPALCFCFLATQSMAQLRRRIKEGKEFYDDGKIKKITRTKTVQSIYIDPYTFFKKTISHSTEYYESGKVKSKTYRKTKIDKSSPGCYEVKVIITTYSESGKILHQEINECDKKRVTNKFYDETGKINFIRINYFLS
jgi:antitoxin component YwqK of YwqJK toxin-antitoxin module